MSWYGLKTWLSGLSVELAFYTRRSWIEFKFAPFFWKFELCRDLGLELMLGPFRFGVVGPRIDWMTTGYSRGRLNKIVDLGSFRFGVTVDTIGRAECPYMKRAVLWLGPLGSLRLHKFYRSDQDEALHDHPWPFVTIPLRTYYEWVPRQLPPAPQPEPGEATHAIALHFPEQDRRWEFQGVCERHLLGLRSLRKQKFGKAQHIFLVRLGYSPLVYRVSDGELLPSDEPRDLVEVKAFRPHYRRAEHRHAVLVDKPTWTIVWAGQKQRSWGFWVAATQILWRDWFAERPLPACASSEEVLEHQSKEKTP